MRCSSAVRATQSLEALALSQGVEVSIERALYLTDATALVELLAESPDGVDTLLVIGHNPTLSDATAQLARSEDRATAARGLPTGGLAVLEHDGAWTDLRTGVAQLVRLVG